MTKLIAQTYTLTHGYRAYITYALVGMTGLVAVLYAANLYRLVAHTVAIREITREASEISQAVQDLDRQYLDLSSSITPDMVEAHGMSQGPVSAYITRGAALGRVALAPHGL